LSSNINIFQGNPDLDPSITNKFDFGYIKRWDKITFNSSAYFEDTKDVFSFVRSLTGDTVNGIPVIKSSPINLGKEEKFGLVSQLNRAVVSVPSNIAEGSSKSSDKHFIIYLENALGSCYEIETQLLVSSELGYISSEDLILLSEELTQIIKMIIKFIKYLQNKL
jgi:four helix bundle protein